MKHLTEKNFFGLIVLCAVFFAAVAVSSFHGAKLINLGIFTFDWWLVTVSLTFLCTDIISEVYGKKYAKQLIFWGFIALLTVTVFTYIIWFLPASPDWEIQKEYDTVLWINNRVLIAYLIAYTVSQFIDITVFAKLKEITQGKFLWLRNNLSTMLGWLADAVLFSTIAFYGTYEVLPIILSAYAIRIMISLIDTPFVYLGSYLLKKKYPDLKD